MDKEKLISVGITKITEDGKVFVDGKQIKSKNRYYVTKKGVLLRYKYIDFDYTGKNGKKMRFQRSLARVVWAWFNLFVTRNESIVHLDGDYKNNSISNLASVPTNNYGDTKGRKRNEYEML